jgi:hypothetical protein
MGNVLSGRRSYHWFNKKETTQGRIRLDVRRLARAGSLAPGASSAYSWPDGGSTTRRADLHSEGSRLTIHFGGACRSIAVPLYQTPCQYGGTRPWFLCPRSGCGCRVAILYVDGFELHCRGCLGLTYQSTRENPEARALRRYRRIMRRLGADPFGILAGSKPPRMRWSTYARLITEAEEALKEHLRLSTEHLGKIAAALHS